MPSCNDSSVASPSPTDSDHLGATSGPRPAFVKKVLLGHNHARSFTSGLWLLLHDSGQSRVSDHIACKAKNIDCLAPYRKSLLTPMLELYSSRILRCLCKQQNTPNQKNNSITSIEPHVDGSKWDMVKLFSTAFHLWNTPGCKEMRKYTTETEISLPQPRQPGCPRVPGAHLTLSGSRIVLVPINLL